MAWLDTGVESLPALSDDNRPNVKISVKVLQDD